jgi:hypothetical protein
VSAGESPAPAADGSKAKIGLVLSGGGGKGAYQIGCWKALRRAGLARFAVISGTSVGALNGALIAQGDLDHATKIWTDLTEQHVLRSVYWRKCAIGGAAVVIATVGTFVRYIPVLILSALFAAVPTFFLHEIIADKYVIRLSLPTLMVLWLPFFVLLGLFITEDGNVKEMFQGSLRTLKQEFKNCLRSVSVRLGRFLWIGTNEPLLNLIKTHVSKEKLRQSGTRLFATITVLEEYWDPFTPKLVSALPRRATETDHLDIALLPGNFDTASGNSRRFTSQEPDIPLIVDMNWIPGPFKGWLPTVIDITALTKDEDVCSALLRSATLPLVFERGTWLGGIALDGGVADLTPLLPALQAGCDLIFVIYLDVIETPTPHRARAEARSRYRWDVCRSLSKIQAVELYQKYCYRFHDDHESFPEPEPPFQLDAAELVFVVPLRSLGRTTDFTGGDRARDLLARGEQDMWAALKRHPTLRQLLESSG